MNYLQQIVQPYAQEAREWATAVRGDGAAYIERVISGLDRIVDAVNTEEWREGRMVVNASLADLNQIWDLDSDGLVVPQGTMWQLESFNGVCSVGSGVVILRANGKLRGVSNITTSGPQSAGVVLFAGVRFNAGDLIQVETTGLAAGRTLELYFQFKAKAIKAPATHSASIGRPEYGADRPNDSGDDLDRHSTPGVFLGTNIRGDAARDPHLPPALPYVR